MTPVDGTYSRARKSSTRRASDRRRARVASRSDARECVISHNPRHRSRCDDGRRWARGDASPSDDARANARSIYTYFSRRIDATIGRAHASRRRRGTVPARRDRRRCHVDSATDRPEWDGWDAGVGGPNTGRERPRDDARCGRVGVWDDVMCVSVCVRVIARGALVGARGRSWARGHGAPRRRRGDARGAEASASASAPRGGGACAPASSSSWALLL